MSTIAQPVTTHKSPKAYFAHLDDTPGTLAQVDGAILFLAEDSHAVTVITPEHLNFLTVLGEIGLAETQWIRDKIRGGYVTIACSREMLRA